MAHSQHHHVMATLSLRRNRRAPLFVVSSNDSRDGSPSNAALSTRGGGAASDANAAAAAADNDKNSPALVVKGRALLCLVALLYGTLNVSLRLVYQLPEPPSAAAMSATRGWLAAICFVPALFMAVPSTTSAYTTTDQKQKQQQQSSLFKAALELAIWNALAQGLLNVGLLSTGSARASFLTQLSVVLTPILSLVAGQAVSTGTWVACGVALVGLTLLSGVLGGAAVATSTAAVAFSTGDLLVLGGALSWSCYLFRLSQIAASPQKLDEVQLQFIKSIFLAILYSIWLIGTVMATTTNAGSFGSAMASAMAWATTTTGSPLLLLAAWGALLYSALGPGTVADVWQQQGQRHVTASEANVLLSMEPVFAAICARLVLGETTTMTENLGGSLILAAAVISATTSSSNSGENSNKTSQ